MRYKLGHPIRTSDDVKLELADVVMHPRTRKLTHIVVEPHHRHNLGRLLPVDLVTESAEGGLRLTCSGADVDDHPVVEQITYERMGDFPIVEPGWAVGIEEVLSFPYHYEIVGDRPWPDDGRTVAWDRVPADEIEVRRDSKIRSSDGRIVGQVDGFVCDDEDHVTHLILRHGHQWSPREVMIPATAIEGFDNDQIQLSITKVELADLPDAPDYQGPWWRQWQEPGDAHGRR